MAQKLLKPKKAKIAPKKDAVKDASIVLVGTYKEKQLAWIKKNGVYNYPVKDGDELTDEACGKVRKAVEQFKADGAFAPLAAHFPSDLAQVSREQLRVCEAAVQMEISMHYRDTVAVQPLAGFKLLLTFGDGAKGVFDCNPHRKYEFMADVWDENVFNKVVVDHGTVIWPGGEDLCPDDLYDDCGRT